MALSTCFLANTIKWILSYLILFNAVINDTFLFIFFFTNFIVILFGLFITSLHKYKKILCDFTSCNFTKFFYYISILCIYFSEILVIFTIRDFRTLYIPSTVFWTSRFLLRTLLNLIQHPLYVRTLPFDALKTFSTVWLRCLMGFLGFFPLGVHWALQTHRSTTFLNCGKCWPQWVSAVSLLCSLPLLERPPPPSAYTGPQMAFYHSNHDEHIK